GAVRDGLPAGPVVNKAYEGMAKGIREQEVVRAMERTRERYSYAYRSARKISGSEAEVKSTGGMIADGMDAGLKEQDAERIVDKIRQRAQGRKLERMHGLARESFRTARVMARYRVPSGVASAALCGSLENFYQAQEMEMLRQSFMRSARYGNP